MISMKTIAAVAVGIGIGTVLTKTSSPAAVVEMAGKVSMKIIATGLFTAIGAVAGAVYGAGKGARAGEKMVKPGDGAFQIPAGIVLGGLVGGATAGAATFFASAILLARL